MGNEGFFLNLGKDIVSLENNIILNCTTTPEECTFTNMADIVSPNAPEQIYISPVGCFGIIRRKQERNLRINQRLEKILLNIASQISSEEIEKRSRVQKRGRFSTNSDKNNNDSNLYKKIVANSLIKTQQINIFDYKN